MCESIRKYVACAFIGAFVGLVGGTWITLGREPWIIVGTTVGFAVVFPLFSYLERYSEVVKAAATGAILCGLAGAFMLPMALGWSMYVGAAVGAAGGALLMALVAWAFDDRPCSS